MPAKKKWQLGERKIKGDRRRATDTDWERVDKHFNGEATAKQIALDIGVCINIIYKVAHEGRLRVKPQSINFRRSLENDKKRREQ